MWEDSLPIDRLPGIHKGDGSVHSVIIIREGVVNNNAGHTTKGY